MKWQTENPQVSVIIPTYNSAETLHSCLRSLEEQTYKPHEVIVVDSHSLDETIEIAKHHDALVFLRDSNQAEARNVGLARSSGKYVLFLDSDQSLSPSVIEECVGKCEKEKAGMVRIPELFVGKGYWSSCSSMWKNAYEDVEFQHEKRSGLMHGEPRFFDKAMLQKSGAYDPGLIWGEDYDLYERLRRAEVKEAFCSSVLYHQEATSIKEIFLKNLRYGKSMPPFVKQTENLIFPKMMTHALLTFVEVVRGSRNPAVVLGCFLLLLVKSSSMVIGILRGDAL